MFPVPRGSWYSREDWWGSRWCFTKELWHWRRLNMSATASGEVLLENRKRTLSSLCLSHRYFSALRRKKISLTIAKTQLHANRNSIDRVNWTSSKESAYLFCPSQFSSLLYWYFRISAKSLRGWKALYLWAQVIAVFPYFATDAASIVIVDRRPAARPWEVTLYMVSPPLHNKMGKVNDIQLWYNFDTTGKLVYIYGNPQTIRWEMQTIFTTNTMMVTMRVKLYIPWPNYLATGSAHIYAKSVIRLKS